VHIGSGVSSLLERNSHHGFTLRAEQQFAAANAGLAPPFANSWPAVSRSQLMTALLILASVNGLAPRAIESVAVHGWDYAVFNTFNVSVIVWGAWASACYLAVLANDANRIRSRDIALACIVLAIVALPVSNLSWLSLCLLSASVFWTSPKGSLQQRSAAIFFAICAPMLWGPELLALAAPPLLKIDAFLVGTLMGTKQSGNLVTFLDGVHSMQIWPGCSSFHNISQAALAWVALSQTLGRNLGLRDVLWGGLAMTSAAAVNLGRLSLMAVSPEYFATVHGPLGEQIAGALTIVLIAVICIVGQRRELFTRA
jgi:hypothetical protein